MFFNELKIIKTDNQKYRMIEQARSFRKIEKTIKKSVITKFILLILLQ